MPRVSVIIPTYNRSYFLTKAIDSVLNQTYTDFEIIVIDDGSTDDTKDVLIPYQNKIKYIYQENQGVACARNTGIKHSTGEFISLLDSDDLYLPNRLEKTIEILDRDKHLGLAHSDVIRITEDGKYIGKFERDTSCLDGYISDELLMLKTFLISSTITFRSNCIERVGYFDEKLSRYGAEDRDMWIRISRYYPIKYIPKVLALYRDTTNSMSEDHEKMLAGRLYVVDKYFPIKSGLNLARKRVLGIIYRKMADWYNHDGNYNYALLFYRKSLQSLPCDVITYWHLMKCCIKKYYNLLFKRGNNFNLTKKLKIWLSRVIHS